MPAHPHGGSNSGTERYLGDGDGTHLIDQAWVRPIPQLVTHTKFNLISSVESYISPVHIVPCSGVGGARPLWDVECVSVTR